MWHTGGGGTPWSEVVSPGQHLLTGRAQNQGVFILCDIGTPEGTEGASHRPSGEEKLKKKCVAGTRAPAHTIACNPRGEEAISHLLKTSHPRPTLPPGMGPKMNKNQKILVKNPKEILLIRRRVATLGQSCPTPPRGRGRSGAKTSQSLRKKPVSHPPLSNVCSWLEQQLWGKPNQNVLHPADRKKQL